MDEHDLDADLRAAAHRVLHLSRSVFINPAHQARLREELLRRHQELSADTTQRAAFKLWPRLTGLKRLTLVAPPALAAAVAMSILLWGLQISGHQHPQTAEAARITRALARTAPRVASWRWTLTKTGPGAVRAVVREQYPLQRYRQHLFAQEGRVLLYSNGHWGQLTADTVVNPGPADWNVAFAVLATELGQRHYTLLPQTTISGRRLQGIRYSTPATNGRVVVTSMWVEPATGLVWRLERVAMQAGRVVERDRVDYRYTMTP